MKAHGERLVFGGAVCATFGITAAEQQAEIGRLMSMPRQLAAAMVNHFGQNDARGLHPAARLTIELSSLERVAHRLKLPGAMQTVRRVAYAGVSSLSAGKGSTKALASSPG